MSIDLGPVVRRSGSAHEEHVRDGRSWCAICGYLDEIGWPTEIHIRYHGDSFTEDGVPIDVQQAYDAEQAARYPRELPT